MPGWSTLKKLIWLYRANGAGGGGTETTITGVSPLLLAAALKKPIKSLTQYGLCSQADTPTPPAPVDIMCNNGALTMVDDELPAGYKRVLGYKCNNNAMWEITGFKLKGSDTVRISFSIEGACNVWGCYQGTDATDNYDLYASVSSGAKYLRYGDGTYLSYWSNANLGVRFDVVYTPNGTTGMPQDSTWTPKTFTSANDLLIGSTTVGGTSSKMKGNFYGSIEVDGRLKLIPCERVSDGVLGYYDTYSETFYEPYTGYTGAVSLGYDGSHYSLAVVGTPETLTVSGNKINSIPDGQGTFVSPSDANTSRIYKAFPTNLSAGRQYTVTVTGSGWTIIVQRKKTDGTDGENVSGWVTTYDFTPEAGYVYGIALRIGGGTANITPADFNGTLSLFADGGDQTATAPDLYAVGDYVDEVEIVSGAVKHKVGITILTGEEEGWALSDSGTTHRFRGTKPSDCYTPASRARIISSHFVYVGTGQTQGGAFIGASSYWYWIPTDQTIDTADKWTAWLKAQYAQGTPVIVLYPLKEETTESVTPQPLNTAAGDNTISVTANVSPIQLEATYIKETA